MKKGKPRHFSNGVYSVLFILSFLFLIFLTSHAHAEVAGPGWLMGEAAPVSHKDAESYYTSGQAETAPLSIKIASAEAVTPEITELARALQYDPRLIYEYIHNHIDYVPYFGSLKGAALTYLDGSGNDFDQASLMIALLRESSSYNAGIGNVQYVYGTMTIPNYGASDDHDLQHWLGVDAGAGVISRVISSGGIPVTVYLLESTMDRVWVKATIDGADYVFDPAFKIYEDTAGIDLLTAMGYNKTDILSAAGGEVGADYVRNLNDSSLSAKLADYSGSLITFLQDNYPNAAMEEIIGGRKIISESLEQYPTGLRFPYTITAYWDSIPDAYAHKVHIQHGGIDQTLSIHEIAGKRLAITYDTSVNEASALNVSTSSPSGPGTKPLPARSVSTSKIVPATRTLSDSSWLIADDLTMSYQLSAISYQYREVPALSQKQGDGGITVQDYQGTVDFGRINIYGYADWGITLTNPSTNPTLNVTSELLNNTSGAYTIISGGGSRTIAPGGSLNITVRFSGSGQARGTKTATFNLDRWYTGYPHTYDTWDLTGFVAEYPNLSGSYGINVSAYLNQPVDTAARLQNSGSQSLTIDSVTLTGTNPDLFQILSGGGAGTVSAGGYRDINIRYLASSRGTHTANAHITFTYDGISGYQIDLPLQGQTVLQPDFTGSYGINFGQIYLNDPADGTAVLKNSGTLNLTINSIALTGTDTGRFQILSGGGSGALSPGQARNIDVRYLADAIGTHEAAISVDFTYDGISNSIDLSLAGETVSAPAAQLWLEDGLIAQETGPVSGPGQAALTLTIDHPYSADSGTYADQTSTYNLKRGSSYVIISEFGGSREGRLLKKRQRTLDAYRTGGLPDTSREVLTETLNIMGQTWMQQTTLSDNLLSQLSDVIQIRHHRFGIMAQERGYYVDVKTQLGSYISRHNISTDEKACFKAGSFLHSALEHGALEQLQGVDRPAASTIKLMHIANAQGDKVFLVNDVNFSTIEPQLTGYSAEDLQDFQDQVTNGATLVLPANGQIVLEQWRGKGYVTFSDSGSKADIGMIIGGDYYGGFGAYEGNADTYAVVNEYFTELLPPGEVRHEESKEPVDMTTGAYIFDHKDLALGGAEPNGLHFSRFYNSDNHNEKDVLGYGWTHSYNIYLSIHSDVEAGIAMRQPVDAVALLVSFIVTLDLMQPAEPSAKEWMTSVLTGKWAMDQLFENAVSVHLQDKVLTYIELPDSAYSPPPGVTTQLVKELGLYSLKERFGTVIAFNIDNKVSSWTDVDGNAMTFAYDTGKLKTVSENFGRTLTLNYTGELLTSVTDSDGRSVSYGYTNDDLTGYTDPELKVWSYGYDDTNHPHRMTSLTDPLTVTTATNTYDSLGRVKTQTVPRQIGTATYNFYFSGFRNVEEDPDGNTITYYIDEKGRTTGKENQLGYKNIKEYDGQSHVVKTTDPRLNSAAFEYDGNHNLTKITNALSKETNNTYDAQFRLTDTIDPLLHGKHFEYDTEHHLISSKYGIRYDGSLLPADNGVYKTEATYYTNGFTETATDGRLTVSTFAYDAYGNPWTTKVGVHPAVTTAYNSIGWLQSLTDQVNTTTSFDDYNNRGQLKLKTDPLLKTTIFHYDDAGRMDYRIDRNNHRIDYGYTPTGKLETITYPDTSQVSFSYDQHDDLTGMQDALGSTGYTYYPDHSLETATDPHGFLVTYKYDEAGNLTELTYPGNKKIIYTYDALNRLETVRIDWLNKTATYIYDDAGRPEWFLNFNGTDSLSEYDNANRLTYMDHYKSGTGMFAEYSFTLDGNGNRTQVDKTEPLTPALNTNTVSYTYNPKKNRLLTANATGFGYDDEGQLKDKDATLYTFDYEHRLKSIGSSVQFYYDGKGNRLKAIRNGVETRYIYDAAGNLLAEADNAGAITKYYIHGLGLLAMVTPADQVYVYHFNAVGSTIAMTDSGQNIVNMYAYTPFGEIANEVESVPQPFKFIGQHGVMTEPNGFYYMRARYYDPEVGRFVSEDPAGFDGGDVNLYLYASNNPMLFIDPWGLTREQSNSISAGPHGLAILGMRGPTDSRFMRQRDMEPLAELTDNALNNSVTNTLDAIPPGQSTGNAVVDLIIDGFQILRGTWNSIYNSEENRERRQQQ